MIRTTALTFSLALLVACQPVPPEAIGDASIPEDAGEVAADAGDAGADSGFAGAPLELVLLVGEEPVGSPRNRPADWPSSAGAWNGKAASFNPGTGRLVFETHREDIRGGSLRPDGGITALGVTEVFVAGPGTGSHNVSGTSVLYVADAMGASTRCLGCTDVADGVDGSRVYRAVPSPTSTPNTPLRMTGAIVYANQNKDLGRWLPNGEWLLAGVEMPRHALTHDLGNAEVGMFNDLWAISVDGKTWVQLTDYRSTWTHADTFAVVPYSCAQVARCPAGCQYRTLAAPSPYEAYSCSAPSLPPPASGTMRPVVSNRTDVPPEVIWSERVGLSGHYVWGGVLQLARAKIAFVDGLPTLVSYERNLTPTPQSPEGRGLWRNPSGGTVVGAGYESWDFSEDDSKFALASDVFLSTSDVAVQRSISSSSQAFTDVGIWRLSSSPALENATSFNAVAYPYADNGAPYPVSKYGHWEEPAVFLGGQMTELLAFASSANLSPPWNPTQHLASFALEVWAGPLDRSGPMRQLTQLNRSGATPRHWAYPTSFNPEGPSLYVTVVRSAGGANDPGKIFRMRLP